MSDPLEIDVFWSFRSPWSYLATPRLVEWQRRYALTVRFRPVYPLAIRTPEFFDRVHPQWPSYFMRDLFRVAEFLGLPMAPPKPDPVVQEFRGGRFVTGREQPYIHRLTRLGALAEERGHGIEFADEVGRLIWGGTQDWDQGDHLSRAAQRAGLDLAELDAAAQRERDRIEGVIEQNQKDHEAAGHWGVPTCAFRGEPFFGQDRLDVLLWRLRKNGLEERKRP
jgi:2-hydroxychromene-2-carboxylate isomerase